VAQVRLRRDPEVLRDIGRAGFERRQDPDHHGDGALEEEGDVIAGRYAMLGEQGSEPIGLAIELAIRDGLAEVRRGHGAGMRGHLGLEGVVDAVVGKLGDATLTEALEEPLVGAAQVAHCLPGEGVSRRAFLGLARGSIAVLARWRTLGASVRLRSEEWTMTRRFQHSSLPSW
jgi:hypothetical protein